MTQAITLTNPEQSNDAQLVTYDVTVEQITKMGEQYLALHADTRDGEAECRKARQTVVSTRTGVDKRRKAMGEEARAYLDRVNGTAKTLIAALAPIEDHLDTEIKAVEAERERIKQEKAAAAQKEIDDRIAAAKVEAEELARVAREVEEARLAAEREALRVERERMAAEEAERKRLAAEAQALIDAENARKQRELDDQRMAFERAHEAARVAAQQEADRVAAEAKAKQDAVDKLYRDVQAKLDEQRRQVEAEAARVEAARIAQERAEADRVAAAQAETERLAEEERERVATEKRKAELEAARPDAEKLDAYMTALLAVPVPDMATETGLDARLEILDHLELAGNALQAFIDSTKTEDGTWLTD